MDIAWFQSRYDKAGPGGTGADYINCPLTREQYDAFVDALLAGDKVAFHDWEATTPYFDGCLPIEVMAERGRETLRHGPMKPVGLTNPHAPGRQALCRRAAAPGQRARHAVQHGRLPDQAEARRAGRIFRIIPGLENAEFARLGGLHRNTFLNSPKLLDATLRLKADPRCALPARSPAARAMWNRRRSACWPAAWRPPSGAARRSSRRRRPRRMAPCSRHITGGHIETIDAGPRSFQPMNVNFGLFPPLTEAVADRERRRKHGCKAGRRAVAKRQALTARALADLDALARRAPRRRRGGITSAHRRASRSTGIHCRRSDRIDAARRERLVAAHGAVQPSAGVASAATGTKAALQRRSGRPASRRQQRRQRCPRRRARRAAEMPARVRAVRRARRSALAAAARSIVRGRRRAGARYRPAGRAGRARHGPAAPAGGRPWHRRRRLAHAPVADRLLVAAEDDGAKPISAHAVCRHSASRSSEAASDRRRDRTCARRSAPRSGRERQANGAAMRLDQRRRHRMAARLAARSPASASRHHCRRISPSSGSRRRRGCARSRH